MANPKMCWYCDFFFSTLIGTNQGQCRKHAPKGLDTNMFVVDGDRTQPFPEIYDAATEWCGDFKQATVDPGDPN